MKVITSAFDLQAMSRPSDHCLIFADESWTFQEVACRANQVARYLNQLGVKPGSLVGVFINRSPEMMIALLAVLKAGGAYVPLDPDYPRERTRLLIDDARVAVILSTRRVCGALPETAAQVVILDEIDFGSASLSPEPFECPAGPADLAYVIYTSGSTGKPKGVMVEHYNVLSFFAAMDSILGTRPGIWLAVTSICFDISVLELLWTLTRGFRVVLHGDEGIQTIASELIRHAVTHFQATPSLARMLASDPASLAALSTLQTVLLGGEALPVSLASTLKAVLTGKLYNMYGPTETTIWSTAYLVSKDSGNRHSVPIGKPLANTVTHILDPGQGPVPMGEPGELYLGGEGVARGYWMRPDLTNERFVADPSNLGGRMYRTGDVVRSLPSGELEFLGRTDFQVKLRGHRIELAEIEAALEQHTAVKAAVVVALDFAREGRPEDLRLVAYVVPRPDTTLVIEKMRTALAAILPDHMVPSHFVEIGEFPLTSNGKIDRRALPFPGREPASTPAKSELPRDEFTRVIQSVWAESLGLEQVGLDDNIMDLGASSLMMPEVQIELQRRLGREISLVDLFEFHTVRTLANHLGGDVVVAPISERGLRRRAVKRRGRSE